MKEEEPPSLGMRVESLKELLTIIEPQDGGNGQVTQPYVEGGARKVGSVRGMQATWYFLPLGTGLVATKQEINQPIRARLFSNGSRVAVVEEVQDYRCPADDGDCAERYDIPTGVEGPPFYCLSDYEKQCVVAGKELSVEVFLLETPASFVRIDAQHMSDVSVETGDSEQIRVCSRDCCWTI